MGKDDWGLKALVMPAGVTACRVAVSTLNPKPWLCLQVSQPLKPTAEAKYTAAVVNELSDEMQKLLRVGHDRQLAFSSFANNVC